MANRVDTDKRKGGRPAKLRCYRKTRHVNAGFTAAEYNTVQHRATKAGMSVADYVHDAALGAKVKAHISDEQIEEVRNLTGMGNNLNQITRKVNTYGLEGFKEVCWRTVGDIAVLVRRIIRGGDLSK